MARVNPRHTSDDVSGDVLARAALEFVVELTDFACAGQVEDPLVSCGVDAWIAGAWMLPDAVAPTGELQTGLSCRKRAQGCRSGGDVFVGYARLRDLVSQRWQEEVRDYGCSGCPGADVALEPEVV